MPEWAHSLAALSIVPGAYLFITGWNKFYSRRSNRRTPGTRRRPVFGGAEIVAGAVLIGLFMGVTFLMTAR